MAIGDSPFSGTGFGEELRHVLLRIDQTGKFDVAWQSLQHLGFPITIHDTMFSDIPNRKGKVKIYGSHGDPMRFGADAFLKNYRDILPELVLFMGDPRNIKYYLDYKTRLGFPFAMYCYDEETEVLTKEGFKHFKDVTYNDEIATLNKEGYLEYYKPIALQKYYYEGMMYHWIGKSYDLLVTPEHKLYVRKPIIYGVNHKFELREAREIYDWKEYEFKKDAMWLGKVIGSSIAIPKVEVKKTKYNNKGTFKPKNYAEFPMREWIRFMAWFLSEGCTTDPKRYVIFIAQENTKNREEICKTLEVLNIHYGEVDTGVGIYSKQLWTYLRQFGKSHDKFIPQYIKDSSPSKIKIFLETYMKGDGHKRGETWHSIFTVSSRMRDDLMELLVKIGKASDYYERNNGYFIQIKNVRLTPIICQRKNPPRKAMYRGYVYDLTVPNHTLFIRRNGKTLWSGNCTLDGTPIHPQWKEYLKYVNLLITMTKWAQEKYREVGLNPAMIHHGVNAKWWKVNPQEKYFIRQTHNIPDDAVVFVNWDIPQHRKRPDALLRCWKEVLKGSRDRQKRAVLLLYSDWNLGGSMGFNIEGLIKQYKIPRQNIVSPIQIQGAPKYWSGAETPERLKEIVCMGDIMPSTTSGEGFGKTGLEAMAMGMPVIITDYSACSEVHQKGSILVPTYRGRAGRYRMDDRRRSVDAGIVNEKKFVDAMIYLFENEKERRKLGNEARRWSKHFDYDKRIIPEWTRLLSSLDTDLIAAKELLSI